MKETWSRTMAKQLRSDSPEAFIEALNELLVDLRKRYERSHDVFLDRGIKDRAMTMVHKISTVNRIQQRVNKLVIERNDLIARQGRS